LIAEIETRFPEICGKSFEECSEAFCVQNIFGAECDTICNRRRWREFKLQQLKQKEG
jgi:hypothetical protein